MARVDNGQYCFAPKRQEQKTSFTPLVATTKLVIRYVLSGCLEFSELQNSRAHMYRKYDWNQKPRDMYGLCMFRWPSVDPSYQLT